MDGIYAELDNENGLRSYPFAAGCSYANGGNVIPHGVFVDAMLYPVNPDGILYLSSISESGEFRISDSSGVKMSGTASGCSVDLYDLSPAKRHVGTLVASSDESLSSFLSVGTAREYSSDETAFAASCVFPVVIDGVTSVSVGSSVVSSGILSFSNGCSDEIRVASFESDGSDTLRFDVLSSPGNPDARSIRRIICVVDGQTPFRIEKLAYNVVNVSLNGISRDDVCSAAHAENSFEMADTCGCAKPPDATERDVPDAYQLVEVFIPPDETFNRSEGGIREGSQNAFFLVTPNVSGYDNPISITLEDGGISPRIDDPEVNVGEMSVAEGELADDISSRAIVIQVPGLSGGM